MEKKSFEYFCPVFYVEVFNEYYWIIHDQWKISELSDVMLIK